ncbi:MAG: hypothetical protein ACXV2B_05355 [Halobacteriota archaeon]
MINDITEIETNVEVRGELSPTVVVELTPTEADIYKSKLSVERAATDDEIIVPKSRTEYVTEFKTRLVKTAESTLEMCRTVYEAHRVLDPWEFKDFCKDVGYNVKSSAIRKFISIGKVHPQLIKYAKQLPASWTSIYLITQLPADEFEQLASNNALTTIKGKELNKLLFSTRSIESIASVLPIDKQWENYVFGKLMFTKRPDETDWRAMQKALAELQARLPIRFVVNSEANRIVEARKLARYEHAKTQYQAVELEPEKWDLGRDANASLPLKGEGEQVAA